MSFTSEITGKSAYDEANTPNFCHAADLTTTGKSKREHVIGVHAAVVNIIHEMGPDYKLTMINPIYLHLPTIEHKGLSKRKEILHYCAIKNKNVTILNRPLKQGKK